MPPSSNRRLGVRAGGRRQDVFEEFVIVSKAAGSASLMALMTILLTVIYLAVGRERRAT
jgi:hypothetical protein